MDATDEIMWEFDALKQLAKKCLAEGAQTVDICQVRDAAERLQIHTAQVAITLPKGEDREFVAAVRQHTTEIRTICTEKIQGRLSALAQH